MSSDFTIVPATPERWEDLAALFGPQGACGGCWCMFWRMPHAEFHRATASEHRADLQAIVESGTPPGLLAYAGEQAAGWCAVAPRSEYMALARSRILKPLDDQPVWSVTCFFIAKPFRRQGVHLALLRGAVEFARAHGAPAIEGYPLDMDIAKLAGQRLSGAGGYMGLASVFREAGFHEMRRASNTQVIMRCAL